MPIKNSKTGFKDDQTHSVPTPILQIGLLMHVIAIVEPFIMRNLFLACLLLSILCG